MFTSIHQTNDYYISKKSRLYRLKANIIGSKLIHKSGFHNDYVEYYILIETDYTKWQLKKRYEDFYKLNSKLELIIPEAKNFFPQKRLFKSSDKTVRERIKCFNDYLSYICCNINIFLIDDFMNFIAIKKEIIQLFLNKYSMLNFNEENDVLKSIKNAYKRLKLKEEKQSMEKRQRDNFLNKINSIKNETNLSKINNYYESILQYEIQRQSGFDWDEPIYITPKLFVIKEFLTNLNENFENNMDILITFEKFLNKDNKWINFSQNEIRVLFIGEEATNKVNKEIKDFFNNIDVNKRSKKIAGDFKFHSFFEFIEKQEDFETMFSDVEAFYKLNYDNKVNGLFSIIGNYKNNTILSVGAMNLLDKLIDPEYNPDAELYINEFRSYDIQQYSLLNLNNIIKNNIGGNINNMKALKLLKLIFYENNKDKYERIIMKDDIVYKQYLNYLEKFCD
jgi:hypothetical protein